MNPCPPGSTCIGPFLVGELPAPLEYQFLDANGAPMDLTGYTAQITFRLADGLSLGPRNAVVSDPTAGIVTYTWQGDEFPTAGRYAAWVWVGNGVNRYASVIIRFGVAYTGAPTPAV